MSFNPGDQISYRLIPEICRFSATVLSVDEGVLVIRLSSDTPAAINHNQYLVVIEPDTDIEHYSEVAQRDGQILHLRRIWSSNRDFFRVDDIFPVAYRRTNSRDIPLKSSIFTSYAIPPEELYVRDESVSPRLWKMLTDMNVKLSMILERLNLGLAGFSKAESIPVNISASGMRFLMRQKTEIGDIIELKILLPVQPPVGVLIHGKVVRVEDLGADAFCTSLRFVDMVDEVRDVIIQLALKHQREYICRQRQDAGLK